MKFLDGYKTYLAGAGLIGLGIYQLSQGQVEPALASFALGLQAFGLRSALAKVEKNAKEAS